MEELFNTKSGFTHEGRKNITKVWITPPWIFSMLGIDFDLDPCTEPGGIPHIPAKHHFCEADNGLRKDWFGRVWLNPPYGDDTPAWLSKMNEHRNGIALVFARTDTEWFHSQIAQADAIFFLKGRVPFINWRKENKIKNDENGPGSGSMLVAWGGGSVSALRNIPGNKGLFIELPKVSIPKNGDLFI